MSGMYAFPARLVRSFVSKLVPITSARTCLSVPGIDSAACASSSGLAERFQYHMTSSDGSEEIVSGEPQPAAASSGSEAAPARTARRPGPRPGGAGGGGEGGGGADGRRDLTADWRVMHTLLVERSLDT